jgi:asparagine synthase (glutamine-hydrolysing)
VDEQKLADNFEDSVYHTEHHIFDLNTTAKSVLSSLPHRHGIKAVLSGEGSDELFAGYSYFTADFLRDADYSVSDSMFADDAQRLGLQSKVIAEMREIVKPQGLKLSQESDLKAGMTLPAILSLFPQGDIFASWVAARKYAPASTLRLFFAAKEKMQEWHSLHKSLYAWAKTILPNTILTGLGDRSEMRNSIEGRPPFLDHHLADHVNSLPPSVKMAYSPGQGQGLTKDNAGDYWWKGSGSGLQSVTEKWILREAVRPFISEEMYRRRKLMFLAPIRWPKNGPLHMMFQRILTQESVGVLGFVNWPVVQDALERGFGEAADGACFRTVIYAASWVTIYSRFKSGEQTTMDRS